MPDPTPASTPLNPGHGRALPRPGARGDGVLARGGGVPATLAEKPAQAVRWVFYEGPPTANGKPGVHHVISRAFKDVFPRFKTMQGFHVNRKGGWDTHGLPVEIAIEQRLGFKNKQEVEDYGIAALQRPVPRVRVREHPGLERDDRAHRLLGRPGDAYVTYDPGYVESCWWVMKELWDRGLLAEDYKATWHSPSSNTTLASHEVALGYREDVPDPSVYPAFPALHADLVARGLPVGRRDPDVAFLAWTTTPWTLAANTGLAVHPEATYALVRGPARKDRPRRGDARVRARRSARRAGVRRRRPRGPRHVPRAATWSGATLPTAPARAPRRRRRPRALVGWRVVADDFVTLDDGTGIVHLAPAYGDLEVGRRHGLPTRWSVDLAGQVLPEVAPRARRRARRAPTPATWFKDADEAIIRDLEAAGAMLDHGIIRHAYPFNWRDGQPLLNVAKKSWYIRTSHAQGPPARAQRPDRLAPGPHPHRALRQVAGEQRRLGALARALLGHADAGVARRGRRDGRVGSVAELAELAGRDLTGSTCTARPSTSSSSSAAARPSGGCPTRSTCGSSPARCPTPSGTTAARAHPRGRGGAGDALPRRLHLRGDRPDPRLVLQPPRARHAAHRRGRRGRAPGPLHHLAGATSAFKNVIVLGHIVDEKGEKMSKSKGNVVDPWSVLDRQGADALRWYLFASSPPEATKRFSQALVEETLRDVFMTLWNTYAFFVLYANLDRPDLAAAPPVAERPLMDRWLHARLQRLIAR